MHPDMDPQRLAAYADNALDPDDAAEVAAHLDHHPADRALVAAIRASNRQIAAAFADPLSEPVPQAMRDLILGSGKAGKGGNVVPLRRRRFAAPLAGLALAASVAAVTLVALTGPDGGPALVPGPLAASDPLVAGLDRAASGQQFALGRGTLEPRLSFFDGDGRPCREIALTVPDQVTRAIACKSAGGWAIEAAMAEVASAPQGSEYVPASGAEGDPLDAALDRLDAGPGLDPATETALITAGWPARP